MKLEEFCEYAKTCGYTHVRTAAGWVNLDEWTPYGKREGHFIGFTLSDGHAREITNSAPMSAYPLTMGVWELGNMESIHQEQEIELANIRTQFKKQIRETRKRGERLFICLEGWRAGGTVYTNHHQPFGISESELADAGGWIACEYCEKECTEL